MLIILSTALLPLGLIALFTSMESAQTSRLFRQSEARTMASESARRIDQIIADTAHSLRLAMAAGEADASICRGAAAHPSRRLPDMRFAIYDRAGRRLCGDTGLAAPPDRRLREGIETEVRLVEAAHAIRLAIPGPAGAFAVAELPAAALAEATLLRSERAGSHDSALIQGAARLELAHSEHDGPLERRVVATAPIAGGQVELEMVARTPPVTAIEMLMVVSPLLMWVAAAVIGWLLVERLLLSPLAQMQRAILSYRAGDGPLAIPRLTTPALELRGLGEAFRKVTDELAGHEAELEQGLARQTRLTREVHHRVKNNLQVVSSLINLHSRGANDPAVAAAYASIQRRVDALAIVHRNHYAELEENLGVSLRSLVGELSANLRAMAPPECARMAITLNMMPAFVTQDVAVPVAFLITEVVELVTICAPSSSVSIMLQPGAGPERGLLTIDAPGLDREACISHASMDRFRRIIQGLARQLRSTLHHEEESGRYEIEIAIVPEAGS